MKRCLMFFLMITSTLLISSISWGQCPEDPMDNGNCDTLFAIPYPDSPVVVESFPAFAEVHLFVTNDVETATLDSLAGIVIPLQYTRTNPSAYCSVSTYWNTTSTLFAYPDFSRSVFRHKVEGTDTVYYNRQAVMARDFLGRDWDTRLVEVASDSSWVWFNESKDSAWVPPHCYLSVIATGTDDQLWWEGDRVLLATVTFNLEDTMTICIDTTWWPPTARLAFTRMDAQTYFPRTNMPLCFRVDTVGTGVREIPGSENSRPTEFALSQNYPNPFNPDTYIEFELARASHVKIDIFNIVGQKVKTLVDEEMQPGRYVADWDSKDQQGNSVSSGIYFYRMQADNFSDMKKMLLVK